MDGVSHWFLPPAGPPHIALRNISLSVAAGEFVCLIGPSGCGKTTLLNMLGGVIKPSVGDIVVTNVEGQRLSYPIRSLGYMQARDALLPWRTLIQNVSLGLEFQGVGRAERKERVTEALRLVGLEGAGDRYPRQLSHGMRQRGNLARLLATRPAALLMDEPFGALDAQTKANLQIEFGQIWERMGSTVVFVTHDLAEAVLLGDRVVVIVEGEITADIKVPFPRPRDPESLRFDADFQDLVRSLWPLLKGAQ